MELEKTQPNNVLDLPVEIILYHITSYFDVHTFDRFKNVCKCFRSLSHEIEIRMEKLRTQKLQEGKDRFNRKTEIWRLKRDSLTESEKTDLDRKLCEQVRVGYSKHTNVDNVTKEIKELYEKGASGHPGVPVYELSPYQTHGKICHDLLEFHYSNAMIARKHMETIKIQIDSQVHLYCNCYLGNGGAPPDRFFPYTITRRLLDDHRDFDAYFEVILDTLRYYRDAGAIINTPNHIYQFLESVNRLLKMGCRNPENIKNRARNRARIIRFLKFLVEENNADVFKVFVEYDPDRPRFEKRGGLLKMFQCPNLQFLIPHVINPFKILALSEKKKEVFVKGFSEFLGTNPSIFSTRYSRKMLKKLFSVTHFRGMVVERFASKLGVTNFGMFCFILVRKKERKMLKFLLSKEECRKCMICWRHMDSGDSLLHSICSVRGKSERILMMMVQNGGFDVNARNNNNETPIMKSIELNKHVCIQILLENGADLELKDDVKMMSGNEMLNQKSWLKNKVIFLKD